MAKYFRSESPVLTLLKYCKFAAHNTILLKTYTIICIVFLMSLISLKMSIGQETPSFVGLNAGISIPYGKFRSTNLEDGSFALTGLNVNAEGAWFFKPKIGVGASAGFNLNPVDVSALGWEKVIADPFLQDLTIRSDPYLTVTAMAGVYTHLPIYKKFHFSGKVLGGLLYGKTPYQLYKPEYFATGPDYYEITSAKDWKFSWQAGAGIVYDLSPCISLILEGVIMYDQLYFNFNTANGVRTDIHTISLINTTLGFRIML